MPEIPKTPSDASSTSAGSGAAADHATEVSAASTPSVVTSNALLTRGADGVSVVSENADPANVITHTFCGTEAYMAPEVLLQLGHGSAVDFWSLGILFSEIITGMHPFKGANHFGTLKNMVTPGIEAATLKYMSPAAASLTSGLLQKSARLRLGSEEAGGINSLKVCVCFYDVLC